MIVNENIEPLAEQMTDRRDTSPFHPERESWERSQAACTAVCWIAGFGWSDDAELFSGLRLLLGDDWHQQQRAVVLNGPKYVGQEVK